MAGETLVVADASVVVKWFVEEEHSEAALRLRDDYVDRALDIAMATRFCSAQRG